MLAAVCCVNSCLDSSEWWVLVCADRMLCMAKYGFAWGDFGVLVYTCYTVSHVWLSL